MAGRALFDVGVGVVAGRGGSCWYRVLRVAILGGSLGLEGGGLRVGG